MSRRAWITLVVLLAAALAAGTYAWLGNPFDPFDAARFSPETWATASRPNRGRMCRDLIEHRLIASTTQLQIAQWLGNPDKIQEGTTLSTSRPNATHIYIYDLGQWPNTLDAAYLYIYLDATDREVSAEIVGY